jgi:hypothetical protein
MIFSENRYPLFRIMLYRTTPDRQQGLRSGRVMRVLRKHVADGP